MLLPDSMGPECVYGSGFILTEQNKTLMDMWNSAPFVRLRHCHIKGELPSVCKNCCLNNQGLKYYSQFDITEATQTKKDNFNLNVEEFLQGVTVLQSYPVTLSSDMLYECNFSCKLCHLRLRKQAVIDSHINEFFGVFSQHALHMHVSGGEPLLDQRLLKYLDSDNHSLKPNISITTNASLISEEILRKFINFPSVNWHISIDSFQPTLFSKLRAGPVGLETILSNINSINKVRDSLREINSPSEWSLNLQCLLVTDNIFELPNYIRHAATYSVNEIKVCWPDKYRSESDLFLFLSKYPLQEVKRFFVDWESAHNDCSEIEMTDLWTYRNKLRQGLKLELE